MTEATTRDTPERVAKLYRAWRKWSYRWNSTYIVVGVAATSVATLVAANTTKQFLTPTWSVIIAVGSAVLSFLVNTLGAQLKGAAFETAARELEKAMVGYETDQSVSVVELGKAAQRGIDILNSAKKS